MIILKFIHKYHLLDTFLESLLSKRSPKKTWITFEQALHTEKFLNIKEHPKKEEPFIS